MKLYKIPIQKIQQPTLFSSRLKDPQGHAQMSYRYYPSWSTQTLFLFHGLVSNSLYLCPLAHRIAERKIAQVVVPDWRGHGEDNRDLIWSKDSDVIQDFEELLIQIKMRTAVQRISCLGHSFGAQWLSKILQTKPESLQIDQNIFVAPYFQKEQMKTGWMEEENGHYKIIWPKGPRTGKERLLYPMDFLDHFGAKSQERQALVDSHSVQVIWAGQDEILHPAPAMTFAKSQTFQEATHMGIVMDPVFIEKLCDELETVI